MAKTLTDYKLLQMTLDQIDRLGGEILEAMADLRKFKPNHSSDVLECFLRNSAGVLNALGDIANSLEFEVEPDDPINYLLDRLHERFPKT